MAKRYVHEKYQHRNDPEIARMYAEGLSIKAIADRLGVSTHPVTDALKRQGITRRPGKISACYGNPELRAQIADGYRTGESVRRIAERLHVGERAVVETLEDAGVKRRPYGTALRVLTDSQAAELAREYAAGASVVTLAKKYGTSHRTVLNYLDRQHVARRPFGTPHIWTPERKAEAIRRYRAGESQQQIAASFGCHQSGVSAVLLAAGVITRGGRPRGRSHPSWKGGRVIDEQGYVKVKVPDDAAHLVKPSATGYVLEHRLVMARKLGRPLRRSETVHHVNGDRQDNRPENLQLRQGDHGRGVVIACLDCGSANVGAMPIGQGS